MPKRGEFLRTARPGSLQIWSRFRHTKGGNRETNIANHDVGDRARWSEYAPEERTSISIFDLLDAENVRSRSIAQAVDQKKLRVAVKLSKEDAPIKIINELLRLSNIPIQIGVRENDKVVASKAGSEEYSIAQLSEASVAPF